MSVIRLGGSVIRYLAALFVLALVVPASVQATSMSTLKHREKRQRVQLWKHTHTLVFFRNHGRLARTVPGKRALRVAHVWIPILKRELAETRSGLRPKAVSSGIPGWWLAQAACIRSHEGAWTSATGNGYYGAYQFLLGTWASVGGSGLPSNASPGEQTYRAWLVWKRDGGSWREWGTAGMCGLR